MVVISNSKKEKKVFCSRCRKEIQRAKSNPQNKYFWGVVFPHFKNAWNSLTGGGYTDDEIEYEIRKLFFGYKKNGREYFHSLSNSNWETGEWEEKMDLIRKWCLEWAGYRIPLPNEVEYD